MKNKLMIAALAMTVAAPTVAVAQNNSPPAQQYQGQDRTYYEHCKKSSGTTGALAGAGGGGLGAAALGAGPVGIAAGVVGGGLLGRHLDKKHDAAQNRKNGC